MTTAKDADLGGLKATWDICKAQTDQKTDLITNLFKYIDDLSEKLLDTEMELEDKKDAAKSVRGRLAEASSKLNELSREKDRHAFAAFLIDGDSVLFKDELIQQGREGGKKAAALLKTAVEDNLNLGQSPAIHHLQVVVRIYTNIKGLAKTYKESGLLSDASLFDEFVRGLNMGYSLCDYVDAGDGKECSDEKVKALFKLYFEDIHCKQIFFGGSADNGYARMLEPYLHNQTDRARITLVEGPPFAPELARIKDRFRTLSFPDILRKEKILTGYNSQHSLHNTQYNSQHNSQPNPQHNPQHSPQQHAPPQVERYGPGQITALPMHQTPAAGWAAAAAKRGNLGTTTTVSSPKKPLTYRDTWVVAHNAAGQRVDVPFQYGKQDVNDIRTLKMCNSYHLLGECFNARKCTHEHGEKLGPRKMAALQALARAMPCEWGLDCDDPDCIDGHRCTRPNCIRSKCWFSTAMHDVDPKIVTKLEQ